MDIRFGNCIEISGASIADGANADSARCADDTDHQVFNFVQITGSSDTYSIRPSHSSGHCLSVAGGSTANRANIEQNVCGDFSHQQFRMVADGSNFILHTGTGDGSRVIDASASSGNIQQWRDTGSDNQRWNVIVVDNN